MSKIVVHIEASVTPGQAGEFFNQLAAAVRGYEPSVPDIELICPNGVLDPAPRRIEGSVGRE